jgi:hypothetical protein
LGFLIVLVDPNRDDRQEGTPFLLTLLYAALDIRSNLRE